MDYLLLLLLLLLVVAIVVVLDHFLFCSPSQRNHLVVHKLFGYDYGTTTTPAQCPHLYRCEFCTHCDTNGFFVAQTSDPNER